jgi:hypothetical protein
MQNVHALRPRQPVDAGIKDRIAEIWANPDLLALCVGDITLSARLCALLVPIKARLDKSPESLDGDYRTALRQLVEDLEPFVTWAALEDQIDADPRSCA